MIVDANSVTKNSILLGDICIIGAGAAGISIGREFIEKDSRVILVESGGFTFDEETQLLYEGEYVGMPYPIEASRVRIFGGSTYHWAGGCTPLTPQDFESRSWVPHSGWPLRKPQLDPYYERAQSLCQISPYSFDPEFWVKQSGHPLLPLDPTKFVTNMFQGSPPTHFGKVYRKEIKDSTNVTALLWANVVELEASGQGERVQSLHVKSLKGNEFSVSAKIFVLAAGGIENPRLLLISNKHRKAGLGNHHDVVGRFFMEHPKTLTGTFLPSKTLNPWLYIGSKILDTNVHGSLSPTLDVQQREKILNICAILRNDQDPSEGIKSFRSLRSAVKAGKIPEDFWSHVFNVFSDIDEIAVRGYEEVSGTRKLDSEAQLYFLIQGEQSPNHDSRVTLSEEQDSLGVRRVKLDWKLNEIDKRTVRRWQEILGQEMGRAGLGRLQIHTDENDSSWTKPLALDDPDRPGYSNHHMGTTRMHLDPRYGVVDENCQVHGMSNLFIAGSSIFPSCGFSNPTLTIVALALRLAQHLKSVLKDGV